MVVALKVDVDGKEHRLKIPNRTAHAIREMPVEEHATFISRLKERISAMSKAKEAKPIQKKVAKKKAPKEKAPKIEETKEEASSQAE